MTRWRPAQSLACQKKRKEAEVREYERKCEKNAEKTLKRITRLLMDMYVSSNIEDAIDVANKSKITGIDRYVCTDDDGNLVVRGFLLHAERRSYPNALDTKLFPSVDVADLGGLSPDNVLITGHTQALVGEGVSEGEIVFYVSGETMNVFDNVFNMEDSPDRGSILWGYFEAFFADAEKQAEVINV